VKKLYEEFKAFVLRGNILDLAVAVVLGAAFAEVVKTFTDGILMPIVAASSASRTSTASRSTSVTA
jgi:large conductance mechanosensitive channel